MTPFQIQEDWRWSNSNTRVPGMTSPESEYTFDLACANENQFDAQFDSQYSSLSSSQLTTPVGNDAASPDIEGLGDGIPHQLFLSLADVNELERQQPVKDYPILYSPLSATTDLENSFLQNSDSLLPQQPLMMLPMDYSNIAYPSLSDPITDEAIAHFPNLPEMPSLNDPSTSMSGTVLNNTSGTWPDMGMGWSMPPSTVLGTGSGYQLQLPMPPVLSSTPLIPLPSPVPSACAPSPINFASPSTYSPRTDDGDYGETSAPTPASAPAHLVCPEPGCGRDFSTASGLHKHTKCHTKPFVCGVCFGTFGSKKGLERHMWTHHPVEAERQGIPSRRRVCPAPGCSYEGRGDNVRRHFKSLHPKSVANQSSPGSC